MRRPNPVPPIQQLYPQFPSSRPAGTVQQFQIPQQQAIDPATEVMAQIQDVALDIYARLITQANESSYNTTLDAKEMERLADLSRKAAQKYFESLGVQFE